MKVVLSGQTKDVITFTSSVYDQNSSWLDYNDDRQRRKFTLCRAMALNPFTAMFVAPSLGKRPIKEPNLKSWRLSPFSRHLLRMNTWKDFNQKCTILNVDLLQDHQIYCLQACMYARFSAEGVKTAHYILVTISGTGRTTPRQSQGYTTPRQSQGYKDIICLWHLDIHRNLAWWQCVNK